uniref:Uncharacterized protein n=1 Tax=Rhizophora mucronata TaxID=61149 RepID=A0A2P2P9E2_RHIMU
MQNMLPKWRAMIEHHFPPGLLSFWFFSWCVLLHT